MPAPTSTTPTSTSTATTLNSTRDHRHSTSFSSFNQPLASPPRIALNAADEDFDLHFDPARFEEKQASRPGTAEGARAWVQTDEGARRRERSPGLGAAEEAHHQASRLQSGSAAAIADRIARASAKEREDSPSTTGRQSRFVEDMSGASMVERGTNGVHDFGFPDVPAGPGRSSPRMATRESSSPPHRSPSQDHRGSWIVDPATIPIRTSSSRAVTNGSQEKEGAVGSGKRSSIQAPRSPRKHRSLGSVPEMKGISEARARMQRRDGERRHVSELTNGHSYRQSSNSVGLGAGREADDRPSPRLATSMFPQPPTSNSPSSQPHPSSLGDPLSQNKSSPLQPTPSTELPQPTAGLSTPSSNWTPEKENILRGPFDYLESHPGKSVRTHLINAFNAWLRVPAPSLAIITNVVGMLHTASLLIDDVEDSSSLRRGVPVAHQIFGPAQTINSANYIYFLALQELGKLNNPECVRIYTEELLCLHRGQGMDLFWRDTLTCPSEEDYLEMVGNKTGGLFRLAIKLMCAESPSHNLMVGVANANLHHSPVQPPQQQGEQQLEELEEAAQNPPPSHRPQPHPSSSSSPSSPSSQPTDYIPLVNTIGLLFQILDDYKSLASSPYASTKGLFAEDLTEGKFSFPIIHSIRADPANLVLINILRQKTADEEVKKFAVRYMDSATGSLGYTRRVLRGLVRKAGALVAEVERSLEGFLGGGQREVEGEGGDGEDGRGKGRSGGDLVRRILDELRVEKVVG
ncbi:geranylgeranyl diphosphate synthase 1 [Hortaea werneckii]|nr:geranylgeranyl diphosphate synthase 1 [Hortaea werneckii]KAI7635126.1 geranylgeranyl diphosphate synthase 1 [Hortaea werneckii]KAI7659076.1 geranylgeranyl diphosphate synthase 1 [Hortaea werneckii]KAI7708318.1 geranylgeranyl diphosphate synthase 1 [Hortaea werneckii]